MIPYTDISEDAISQITSVIVNDEGGWRFNEEAGGDWNYAGMLSSNFTVKAVMPIDDRTLKQHLIAMPMESRNKLTIQLYYQHFYLPLSVDIPLLLCCELSCAINIGLPAFKILYSSLGTKYPPMLDFLDAWEDHYIKMVTDNAIAWAKFYEFMNIGLNQGVYGNYKEPVTEPHPLRAPNLQGWINRVRRYRSWYSKS